MIDELKKTIEDKKKIKKDEKNNKMINALTLLNKLEEKNVDKDFLKNWELFSNYYEDIKDELKNEEKRIKKIEQKIVNKKDDHRKKR